MAFLLSPGVSVREIDLTTIVPSVGTTNGGFVGDFVWGPMDQIVTLSNENDLLAHFGPPTANNFKSWFSAANFLAYGNNLQTVRANTVANNATSGSIPLLIKNESTYSYSYATPGQAANTSGMFAARFAGDLGNTIKVSEWVSPNTTAYQGWAYASQFNGCPSTSAYAANVLGANDEMHIIVIDEDGRFTGVANTILEKFAYVSKASDAVNDDGTSNYYVNVIQAQSRYIYIINHPLSAGGLEDSNGSFGKVAAGTTFTANAVSYTSSLANGSSGAASTDGSREFAWDMFKNVDTVDVDLLVTGDASHVVGQYVVDNIAGTRKDCVAFVSPQQANVVNNWGNEATAVVSERNNFNSSSYAFMDCNWKYQYDKYNNTWRWLPLNADIAGLAVRSDNATDAWYSFAGFNRGGILNVTKLAWNPNQTERDILYKAGVNPVVQFQGAGTILYGDKTMLSKPSAFDRVNVRRLFIVLEKAIAKAAKYSLFEFNDEFTRAQFVALVEPYLRDVKGRRGVYDYRVVCDTTNNTPQVIDSNQFVGDIYIKPARSINFIQLNFIAVGTGVSFTEVVGQWG